MSSNPCPNCGCSETDVDRSRGDVVCTGCGMVLDGNMIVSEVQFEDNGRGGSSAIGRFVPTDGCITDGLNLGFARESRAITLERGRKRINSVAQQLALSSTCSEMAFNFFKMAVHKRLTMGRRHDNVVGACLYIVCRKVQTPHMLLDLCDFLPVNIFELGRTYLRLTTALSINIPAIDPYLYIMRFAHRLQFGDKIHEVSVTAGRLVQRMKRDWMHTGRRPSGLCGAALLVAARLHDFNRTPDDVIRVVKVCNSTLRKRLTEFADTPSSRLTLDEFMKIDLEEEQDPPSFKAAREKAKIKQLGDIETVSEEITQLQKKIERQLEEKREKLSGIYASCAKVTKAGDVEKEVADAATFVEEETVELIGGFIRETAGKSTPSNELNAGPSSQLSAPSTSRTPDVGSVEIGPSVKSFMAVESFQESLMNSEKKENEDDDDDGTLDLTDICDEEINSYVLKVDEVNRKGVKWNRINSEYLKELKEKEERAAKEKEEGKDKPEKKKRTRAKRQPIQASTPGEAIEKMVIEKRLSSKINYDVLRSLTSSFSVGMKTDQSATTTTAAAGAATSVVDEQLLNSTSNIVTHKRALEEEAEESVVCTLTPPQKIPRNDMAASSKEATEEGFDDYVDDDEDEEEVEEEEEQLHNMAEILGHCQGEYDNDDE